MNIVVMIPPDHARAKTITPLSQSMLEKEAEPFLNAAAQSLGRNLSHMSRYTKNLLARNYWIVRDPAAVYAFGQFEDPMNPRTLKGGTGWSVQLAIEIMKAVKIFKVIFVYDMYHKAWFELVPIFKPHQDTGTVISPFAFKRLYGKPILPRMSAVVGSRHLDESTKREIKALFERTANSELQHRQQVQLIVQKMKEFHITPPPPSHPNQPEVNVASP